MSQASITSTAPPSARDVIAREISVREGACASAGPDEGATTPRSRRLGKNYMLDAQSAMQQLPVCKRRCAVFRL
jgi:hypothetical protein